MNGPIDSHDRQHRPPAEPPRGPLGDTRPDKSYPKGGDDPRTGGGQPHEPVEDRPAVDQVKPEDYPLKDREDSAP
jgi:hypothetical protein